LRLKRFNEVNLVLSGGAARGIAHLGVLQALKEKGIKVKRVSGVSAGAIVAVLLGAGYEPLEILKLVKEVRWLNLFKFKPPGLGFIGWEKARSFFNELVAAKRLEELSLPVNLCAVDLLEGKPLYFSEGPLPELLFASCAIPGVFEPVRYRRRLLVDGGLMNNLPVEPLEGYPEPVLCVDVLPVSKEKRVNNYFQLIIRSFFLAVRANSEKRRRYCDFLVEPPVLSFSPLDVRKADELFKVGYEAALKALPD